MDEVVPSNSQKLFLLDFPDEILLNILRCQTIDVEDLLSISLVSKRLCHICLTDNIWKRKFKSRWSWNWEQLRSRGKKITDWKNEALFVLYLHRELDEKLNNFSQYLFDKKFYQTFVVNTVLNLLTKSPHGKIYGYGRLLEISTKSMHPIFSGCPAQRPQARPNWHRVLPNAKDNTMSPPLIIKNLTFDYYARKMMQVVRNEICCEDFAEFVNQPIENQSYLEGFVVFERWEDKTLSIRLENIKKSVEDLALECRNHLALRWPLHPVLSKELVPLNKQLLHSLWNEEQSRQILKAINHVFYTKHGFRGERSNHPIERILYVSHALTRRKGLPVTLCVIYLTICHHLGIKTDIHNFPGHFMLKWTLPETSQEEFIDCFSGGRTLASINFPINEVPLDTEPSDNEMTVINVLRRVADHIMELTDTYLTQMENRWFLYERLCMLETKSEKEIECFSLNRRLLYKTYFHLDIYYDRMTEICNNKLINGDYDLCIDAREILRILKMDLLDQQDKKENSTPPTPRTRPTTPNDVCFHVGMIMHHKLYNYDCVITGWDTTCQMPKEWVIRMGVLSLKRSIHQPFYHVLADDGSNRYAAEENLMPLDNPSFVPHKEIGRFFDCFVENHYVPNKELSAIYPCDDATKRS